MADPDVTIKGIFGVNDTAPPNENTGYYLDHVAIEVDMSEIRGLNPGLGGLAISAEGGFEVREDENPGSPVRWVFEAHRVYQDLGSRGGGMSCAPSAQPVARGQRSARNIPNRRQRQHKGERNERRATATHTRTRRRGG